MPISSTRRGPGDAHQQLERGALDVAGEHLLLEPGRGSGPGRLPQSSCAVRSARARSAGDSGVVQPARVGVQPGGQLGGLPHLGHERRVDAVQRLHPVADPDEPVGEDRQRA